MKKIQKLFMSLAIVCFSASTIFAQISDRINSPTTFKAGTRPIAGNMGVSLGTSYQDVMDLIDDFTAYEGLPIVNFKLYHWDDLVLTAGIKYKKTKEFFAGEIDPAVDGNNLKERKFKDMESEFKLNLGAEKHFLQSNIMDVYVGARVPIGVVRDVYVDEETYDDDGYDNLTANKMSFMYGIEGFLGLQAFIADLPVALGFELGISGLGYVNNKTKYKVEQKIGGTTASQTYYIADDDPMSIFYKKLSSRTFEAVPDVRITLSYFFNK